MAWITPVTTWVAGNGIGFSDLNRIEGDLKYLREETATFNGAKTFSSKVTISGTTGEKLAVSKDQDVSSFIGKGGIGLASAGSAAHFYIGHIDHFTSTRFSIRINPSGRLDLNATTGQLVAVRNNNADVATFGSSIILTAATTAVGSFSTNNIFERTVASGVTIDGMLIKDSGINTPSGTITSNIIATDTISERNSGFGVTADGVLLKDGSITATGTVITDDISERNSGLGVSFASEINPTATPTLSSWALTTTKFTIPRGIYSIQHVTALSDYSEVEMQLGTGVWVVVSTGSTNSAIAGSEGDIIFSDGTNFRVSMTAGSIAGTVNYRKF